MLISPGTYHEAVNVVTDDITIRGLDRNEVILDGQFELDNGIRILGASGVVVENLTAQNYTSNGVFALETDGYRVSYVNAIRNGDYGIYGFDSVNGTIEHSYASGSPDAGVYIGQCFPCDSIINDVTSEHNGLGYSGTNSGGDLYIVNSTFRNNRAGVVPNSGSYELCYPERKTTIVGNIVYSNNQPDTPAIDVAILAMGNGILIPGGVGNMIERNLVYDHDKTGIGLVPFLEEGPNDDLPTEDEWDDRLRHSARAGTGHRVAGEPAVGPVGQLRRRQRRLRQPGRRPRRGRRRRRHLDAAQLLVRQRLHHVGPGEHRNAGAVWLPPARATGTTRRSTSCRGSTTPTRTRRRSTTRPPHCPIHPCSRAWPIRRTRRSNRPARRARSTSTPSWSRQSRDALARPDVGPARTFAGRPSASLVAGASLG